MRGWEDPLEEEMVILSNILAWEIPWTEDPEGPPAVIGVTKESDTNEHMHNNGYSQYSIIQKSIQ